MKIELVRRKRDFIDNSLRESLGGLSGVMMIALIIIGMRLVLEGKNLGWLIITFVISFVFWPMIEVIRQVKEMDDEVPMVYELNQNSLCTDGNGITSEIKFEDIDSIVEKPWNFIIFRKDEGGKTSGKLFLKNGADPSEMNQFLKGLREKMTSIKEESVKGNRYHYKKI